MTPAIKLDLAFYFVECNSEIPNNPAMEMQTSSRKFVLVCETRELNLIHCIDEPSFPSRMLDHYSGFRITRCYRGDVISQFCMARQLRLSLLLKFILSHVYI